MRIFVINDYRLLRLGLCNLLQKDPSIEVIGNVPYEGGLKLIGLIEHLNPDVILWQLEKIENDKLDFIDVLLDILLERHPAMRIIIISVSGPNAIFKEAIKSGILECVSPDISLDTLLSTILKKNISKLEANPTANISLICDKRVYIQSHFQNNTNLLSPQEFRVQTLLSQGYSNQDIAGALSISLRTVEAHIHKIFEKLRVNNRMQAIATAAHLGIIDANKHQIN